MSTLFHVFLVTRHGSQFVLSTFDEKQANVACRTLSQQGLDPQIAEEVLESDEDSGEWF